MPSPGRLMKDEGLSVRTPVHPVRQIYRDAESIEN
jgi:hypothetical protein